MSNFQNVINELEHALAMAKSEKERALEALEMAEELIKEHEGAIRLLKTNGERGIR